MQLILYETNISSINGSGWQHQVRTDCAICMIWQLQHVYTTLKDNSNNIVRILGEEKLFSLNL
jgi:hypothetical protein